MSITPTSPAVPDSDQRGPSGPDTGRRGRIGLVVAGLLAAGLLAALLFVAAPVVPAKDSEVVGAVLCGFALGWALLAMLSVRFTDQPQRWAVVPALFMGLSGLLLVLFGSRVDDVLKWVWPPALLVLAIWMAVRVGRELHSRGGRWLLYSVIAILALASIGGGYETVREAADAKAYPPPGRLIDVGGHSLHLNCTGSGSPTVVLEAGGGEMSSNLGWITPAVSGTTRVCVYDRAGRGWSESSNSPQDGKQIATDLHTLLHRGNVPGPYVLAGHSFGGLYVRTFAASYPDEVAGMVLVDSTAAKSSAGSPADPASYDPIGRVSALVSASARVGLVRLYNQVSFESLPPRSRDEVRATGATASNLRSTIDEYVQANSSMEQAAAFKDFAGKPLVVLTAGSGNDAAWQAKQKDLAGLSTNSSQRIVRGASHEALVGDEEYAAATTQAILDVVSAVRSPAR
ncbi:alpha/beta hydrolase [Kribbella jiaozuonensis]|uniref:Alpha/beta hydrolase n=1 Tax=Kribbella jiaozuonensis TaxID=2575441 RepID=A0A4U3M4Y5_9ACTN|nr:alpha/beta hydrolase [Kribbella jiaozuonensis]